jgi:hypothetical protein
MPVEPGGEAGEVVEGRHSSHALAERVQQQQLKKCTYGHFAQEIFVDAHFCDILGRAITGAVALASQRQVAPMSQGMHLLNGSLLE